MELHRHFDVNCKQCGDSFRTPHIQKIYCSDRCAARAGRLAKSIHNKYLTIHKAMKKAFVEAERLNEEVEKNMDKYATLSSKMKYLFEDYRDLIISREMM